MSELILLAKNRSVLCNAKLCGVFIYIYITKALGKKEKSDITNSDLFIFEIISTMATIFLYLKLIKKTKPLPYCYKALKNQQEVPKIWIVNITFFILMSY